MVPPRRGRSRRPGVPRDPGRQDPSRAVPDPLPGRRRSVASGRADLIRIGGLPAPRRGPSARDAPRARAGALRRRLPLSLGWARLRRRNLALRLRSAGSGRVGARAGARSEGRAPRDRDRLSAGRPGGVPGLREPAAACLESLCRRGRPLGRGDPRCVRLAGSGLRGRSLRVSPFARDRVRGGRASSRPRRFPSSGGDARGSSPQPCFPPRSSGWRRRRTARLRRAG